MTEQWFANNNSQFDENSRKFSKQGKNTEEKGELACSELFLVLPKGFKSLVWQTRKNQNLFWKGLYNKQNKSIQQDKGYSSCSTMFVSFTPYHTIPRSHGPEENLLKTLIGECNTMLNAYILYRHLA